MAKASSSSINLNSQEHQRMISSLSRDRCIMIREISLASSMQKSRSLTPSRLLAETASKASSVLTSCAVDGVGGARQRAAAQRHDIHARLSLL